MMFVLSAGGPAVGGGGGGARGRVLTCVRASRLSDARADSIYRSEAASEL